MSSRDQQRTDQQPNQSTYQPSRNSRHAVQPSDPKGDHPATAAPNPSGVQSGTPENRLPQINPSAPEDSNTTPGTAGDK